VKEKKKICRPDIKSKWKKEPTKQKRRPEYENHIKNKAKIFSKEEKSKRKKQETDPICTSTSCINPSPIFDSNRNQNQNQKKHNNSRHSIMISAMFVYQSHHSYIFVNTHRSHASFCIASP
jgi:hypothetical protein